MLWKFLFFGASLLCALLIGTAVTARCCLAGAPPCADTVRATVGANAIHVFHDQAEWNCCAKVEFSLSAHADTLDLFESETFDGGPCHCLCCFDLLTTITGAAAGDYLVRVSAAEDGELFGELWVTVPEVTPGGDEIGPERPPGPARAAGLGGSLQSPCGGWTTGVPQSSTTWGHVKAVFR